MDIFKENARYEHNFLKFQKIIYFYKMLDMNSIFDFLKKNDEK